MKPSIPLLFLALFLSATAAPAPELSVHVNGKAPSRQPLELWQGESLLVEVTLRHPERREGPPVVIASAAGDWADRLALRVTDARGALVSWPLAVTGAPSRGALTLAPGEQVSLVLRLAPEAAAHVTPGDYRIFARLDCAEGAGWRGRVVSVYCPVRVVVPPAQPTGDAFAQRQLLRVRAALAAGDLAAAEAATRELCRAEGRRHEAFAALALVQEAKGQYRFALHSAELAAGLWRNPELPASPAAPAPDVSATPAKGAPGNKPPPKPTPRKFKPDGSGPHVTVTPYDALRQRLADKVAALPPEAPPPVAPTAKAKG